LALLVGGAFALPTSPDFGALPGGWRAPPPLAPLAPQFSPLAEIPELGDSVVVGFDAQAGELLQGGFAPEVSVRRASFGPHVSLGTERWRVGLTTRIDRPVFASSDSVRRLRWLWPGSPVVGVSLDLGRRLSLSLQNGAGTLAAQAGASLPLGADADLDVQARRARDRGRLQVAVSDAPAIPLEWVGDRTGGRMDLRLRPGSRGELVASLTQEEGSPVADENRTHLEGTSVSTGWNLRWEPATSGLWMDASGGHAWVRTQGVLDSAGERRVFHDGELRSWQRSAAAGWTGRSWRAGLRGDHRIVASPAPSYFAPFLSWNVFDPSAWSPVNQILSDQREFVHGTAELRRLSASLRHLRRFGPLEIDAEATTAWNALDPELVLRTTRMNLFGLGYSVRSDTVVSPRLRLWTLEPAVRAVLRLRSLGEAGLSARATAPLAVRRLGPRPPPDAVPDPRAEDPRGLWETALFWRRAW